jgi:tetratricopeptide (TPR) repeat protein
MLDEFLQEGNLEGQMVVLKHLGRLQREGNKFVDAIESHSKGAEIATTLCDTAEMIHAFNNIGTNYRRMSMLEDATVYHYKALKLCEQYSDKDSYAAKKNRVVSLNGIGNISLRTGDMQTADSVFRAALRGEAELGSALGQAINYANLGAIFDSNDQIDSAWVYYTKSLEMNTKANSDLGKSLCYGYFGGLYEKEGKYDRLAPCDHIYPAFALIFSASFLSAAVALAAIFLSGLSLGAADEIISMVLFVFAESAFALVIAMVFNSYGKLGALTPGIVIAMLLLSPIFLNLRSLSFIGALFPTYHYLNSVYESAYVGSMIVYTVAAFALAFVCARIFKTKSVNRSMLI